MAIGGTEDQDRKDDLDAMLTTKEVADLLKVSERHVQNLVRRGKFPEPVKLGKSVRYRPLDIRRILHGDVDDGGLMNQTI